MTNLNAYVHVIESPSPKDLLVGRTEGKTLCEALSLSQTPHWYCLATNRETLISSLDEQMRLAWDRYKLPPVLHLSMHGNDRGIGLTDGDFIEWHDLRETLQPLNNWMKGGLLIAMSACYGSSGCRMAMHDEPKETFWALVGNCKSPRWADAAVAYVVFYHNLFKEVHVEECVKRMRLASGDDEFMFFLGKDAKEAWKNRYANLPTLPLQTPPPTPTPLPDT